MQSRKQMPPRQQRQRRRRLQRLPAGARLCWPPRRMSMARLQLLLWLLHR